MPHLQFDAAARQALAARLQAQEPVFGTDPRSLGHLRDLSQRAVSACPAAAYSDLRVYCMFIGYPRSGHSLIGSLIDAHDDAVIAHELDALGFLEAGFEWRQIFWLILENARLFTEAGRIWGEFEYLVPGRPHARARRLRVIGDKKGGQSTARLASNSGLLQRLQHRIPFDIRMIHVIRNPFDTIAAMALKAHGDIDDMARNYFNYHDANVQISTAVDAGSLIHLYHEEFVTAPRDVLGRLCTFLGLSADGDYASACAKIVYETPRLSRDRVTWSSTAMEFVLSRCGTSPFLSRYGSDAYLPAVGRIR